MDQPTLSSAPETKMGSGGEIVEAFDEFMHAFEAFRETNDERLDAIEKRHAADVITDQKVDRINRAVDDQKRHLDALLLKGLRPSPGDPKAQKFEQTQHRSGFDDYVRRGDDQALKHLDQKAMSVGSQADGGYLVPEELANDIGTRLAQISPIRSIASVRQVSASVYKKPFASSGPIVGWAGETPTRPQTPTPKLSELQFPTMELYAMPAATSTLLDDAAVDMDSWLVHEVETAFAEQESAAFINGTGPLRPSGFLKATIVKESVWNWGKLGYIPTGVAGALAASKSSDVLLDTVYSLKAGYRQNAHWVMNRKVQAELRKLKDADGNYMWQAPATATSQAALMGFPVVEAEDMPDISNNATSIAFGDFNRGYLIVDRMGVRILRDPYSAKPYVLFYITKRVGGGIQDFDAIKLIKFGTA